MHTHIIVAKNYYCCDRNGVKKPLEKSILNREFSFFAVGNFGEEVEG